MKEFEELVATTEYLFGPNGCPWDREQTMISTRPCVIEEAAELVDAIDSNDNSHIEEELGDMFFVVLFLCKLAEKEKKSTLKDVLRVVNEKLIRRHPHVFGEVQLKNSDEVMKQWGEIKKTEKGKTQRKSALDSIPKGLPALARAQKVCNKVSKTEFATTPKGDLDADFENEDELGELLFEVVAKAQAKGLDAEHALRKVLVGTEHAFREFEMQQ